MEPLTGLAFILSVTLGGVAIPIYHTALTHRQEAEKLERRYEEAFGERPLRPYELEGAGRFEKFLYDWPFKVRNGKCVIDIYKGELRQAIAEDTML